MQRQLRSRARAGIVVATAVLALGVWLGSASGARPTGPAIAVNSVGVTGPTAGAAGYYCDVDANLTVTGVKGKGNQLHVVVGGNTIAVFELNSSNLGVPADFAYAGFNGSSGFSFSVWNARQQQIAYADASGVTISC